MRVSSRVDNKRFEIFQLKGRFYISISSNQGDSRLSSDSTENLSLPLEFSKLSQNFMDGFIDQFTILCKTFLRIDLYFVTIILLNIAYREISK